jgi:hypothetical protein
VNPIDPGDLLAALLPVTRELDRLGVAWYVGGSVASGVHGSPRSTMDADVVADLAPEHAAQLAAALGDAYYADEESIREAIDRRSSFNLIHLDTSFKVDVFVAKHFAYDRESLRRRRRDTLSDAPGAPSLPFCTAEDSVLSKLDWYRKGGQVSAQQWRDVQGVLRTSGARADLAYLRRWAPELGVADLLERALGEAGLA